MRLSATLLQSSEQRTNALGERELVLRGLSIPAIEHLAATLDQFDCIDLSDNNLVRLDNFPRLKRLSSLICGDNAIEALDGSNLGTNVPELHSLVLTSNRIGRLDEVRKLGQYCRKLEFLVLVGNPVTRRQHYRLYVINKIPSLKVLDFSKIKEAERERARRLASSAAGAALDGDVRLEAKEAARAAAKTLSQEGGGGAKTFEPGTGSSAAEAFVANFSREQKEQIRRMVAEASSPEEIERIEACVKRGVFPGPMPPSPPHLAEDGSTRKRTSGETNGEDDAADADGPGGKRIRVG